MSVTLGDRLLMVGGHNHDVLCHAGGGVVEVVIVMGIDKASCLVISAKYTF